MPPGEPTAAQRAAMATSRQQTARNFLQWRQESMMKELFSPAQIKQLDKWIASQNDPAIDRPEAIRRLVELGLKAKGK
jgi:hypothetical protein